MGRRVRIDFFERCTLDPLFVHALPVTDFENVNRELLLFKRVDDSVGPDSERVPSCIITFELLPTIGIRSESIDCRMNVLLMFFRQTP